MAMPPAEGALPPWWWWLSRLRRVFLHARRCRYSQRTSIEVQYDREFDSYRPVRAAMRAGRARTSRGARRGANERRSTAIVSDKERLKLLVEPHPATFCLKRIYMACRRSGVRTPIRGLQSSQEVWLGANVGAKCYAPAMSRRGFGDDAVYFDHSGDCRDARHHKGCPGRWRGVVSLGCGRDGKRDPSQGRRPHQAGGQGQARGSSR
jgi:hypothetical protein